MMKTITPKTMINPKYVIASYRNKSRGVRKLARALRALRYKPGDHVPSSTIVINWGDSKCPLTPCLNPPEAIRLASNKLSSFKHLNAAGVPVPRFATSPEDVSWKGMTVVRHKLQGHSGEGIELISPGSPLPPAPLYVEYIKKQDEYRIHVGKVGGDYEIIAVQRKARRTDIPDSEVNWQVRNHTNGFIFARQTANPHTSVTQAAVDALRSSGLDFGAVDVVFNDTKEKAYVLEINTAPGLEGQTIDDYASFFRRL